MTDQESQHETTIYTQAQTILELRRSREYINLSMPCASKRLIEALEHTYTLRQIARKINRSVVVLRDIKNGVVTCTDDMFLELYEIYKERTFDL